MIKASFKILLWRLWDLVVKLIWPYITFSARKYLFSVIDSTQSLHDSISKIASDNSGVFIQVGSNDGISNDPLRPFIQKTTSNVYLIEPLPFLVDKLTQLYKQHKNVKILGIAILPGKKKATFYHLDEESASDMGDKWKPWFDQIGSFSKDHLIKHSSETLPYVKEFDITCSTLDQVITDEEIKEILMLHVDAESYDLDVLTTISIEKCRPHMILFEHKHLPFFKLILFLQEMRFLGYGLDVMHDDVLCIRDVISID